MGERSQLARTGGAALLNIESLNARLRDELLGGEVLYTLAEAQIVIESWGHHDNTVRPYSSLGDRPPAPEVFMTTFASSPKP